MFSQKVSVSDKNHCMTVQGSAQQLFSNWHGRTNKAVCRGRALPKNGPSVIETGNNKKMYHDWVVSLFPGVNN